MPNKLNVNSRLFFLTALASTNYRHRRPGGGKNGIYPAKKELKPQACGPGSIFAAHSSLLSRLLQGVTHGSPFFERPRLSFGGRGRFESP